MTFVICFLVSNCVFLLGHYAGRTQTPVRGIYITLSVTVYASALLFSALLKSEVRFPD